MSRTRRETIAAGAVGLLATAVVLAGASAQEAPPVSQPEPCDTVAEAPAPPGPETLPEPVRDAVPTPLPTTTTPSTVPPVPVETPTQATVPDTVPEMPCQTTTTSMLPPLDDDEEEEYWDIFIPDPPLPGLVDDVPFESSGDYGTWAPVNAAAPSVPGAVPSADTRDAQPIASGGGGFRYAQVFVLPLLMLVLAAAVAWTLTQPVAAPAPR